MFVRLSTAKCSKSELETDSVKKVFQSCRAFDYVVHTASPYHLNVKDPITDFLDPAIKGTTGILKSIKAHAPTVKRVVITSSSAAMVNPVNPPKVYDESSWAPWTWEDALQQPGRAYAASKVLSEKAGWEFVQTQKPNFDLATINNTYTFGPLQRTLASLDAMNTSNHRIRDMVLGKMKGGLEPTAPVFTFVDVRDVALAHVRAMMTPEAGGKRFYVVGGHFSNKQIADVIGDEFIECRERLPQDAVDDMPEDVMQFDNSRSREVLGLKYRGLRESVVDTVKSIEQLRRGNAD
jgi:nucleoside-diphosphate-sugar epimerase